LAPLFVENEKKRANAWLNFNAAARNATVRSIECHVIIRRAGFDKHPGAR